MPTKPPAHEHQAENPLACFTGTMNGRNQAQHTDPHEHEPLQDTERTGVQEIHVLLVKGPGNIAAQASA